jgi:hypothetical protein
MRSRAYYAPALVVFVGGDNFGLAVPGGIPGGIGWFALGPREVYPTVVPGQPRVFRQRSTAATR